MGMTYMFQVAKKGSIPKYQDYEDETGWLTVGSELDREDWISGFILHGEGRNYEERFSEFNIKAAISDLNRLDEEVKTIMKDDRYPIDFRRRLARGLVSNIYGTREYHYCYPKDYYPETSYQRQNWPEDVWEKQDGAKDIVNVLEALLPYTNGEYDIRLYAI